MGKVIAMRAIPGSGKSTLAKQLVAKAKSEGKTATICSADDYFVQLGGGSYKHDPSKIAEAHKDCFRKFMQAISQNVYLIIVDNTNLSAWELSPYKTYAEVHDYDFIINEVSANPMEAFKRQQHGVPQFAIDRMHKNFNNEFIPPWWEKKRLMSKTNEEGNPVFEEEMNEKKSYKINLLKLIKTADKFSKKYRY